MMFYMDVDFDSDASDTDFVPTSENESDDSFIDSSVEETSPSSDDASDYLVPSAEDDDDNDDNAVADDDPNHSGSTIEDVISSPPMEAETEIHTDLPVLESDLDTEISKKQKLLDEAHLSPTPKASLDRSVDDDGQNCPICFEPWTSSSEHRLVSLKCGHLFGQSCISKWLKGHKAKCPQCNTSAKRSDIRKLYARTLKVLDTSERDQALSRLEKESELRCKLQIECTQIKLKYQMSAQECERLKKELIETKVLMNELRSNSRVNEKSSQSCQSHSEFILTKNMELNKQGGCRVIDICSFLGLFVISQPSTNNLFKGYGLKKVSATDFKSEFLYVHQKAIKDVAFHEHDGLVLSASLDGTVKLTSVLSNSIVQSYSLENDVWSCSWNKTDLRYFYAGVKNGAVLLFDTRMTNSHVCQLPSMGRTSPVVAVEHFPKSKSGHHSKSGLLVGNLASCYFYEMLDHEASYRIHPLPLEGSFTSLSCEEQTGHFLASCRPSAKNKQVTHSLCALSFEEDNSVPCNCEVIQTVCGGKTQVQLARSKVFRHPDDDSCVLICSGDEDAQGALVWDGGTGECLCTLKAESPVLDLTTFKMNNQPMLATLTEKNLRFYSWTTAV